ncbi:zinc-binding dehydrogenase [Rhizobium sp. PP-CC-2G-626]|nr:zinc-binding dehydrogenase [Rhizobium sp. PP-CC-2G-626]
MVIGVGGVGLNVISGAELAGASRIIAVDLQAEKEAVALKFGATHFVNSKTTDAVAAVTEITGGGVDHGFEVIGLVPTTQQAIQMARKGGSVYLIGLHRPGVETPVQGLDLVVRQVDVRGVYMGSSNIKNDVPMFADLYLQGRFKLDDLIAYSDEAGHLFRHEAGHPFRFHSGHRSDLKPASWCASGSSCSLA